MGNSSGAPMACQVASCFSKTGPIAKPRAGSRKATVATAPATLTVPVMNRRRVTVSPSNAPGMSRSAVYLLSVWRGSSAMSGARNLIAPGFYGHARARASVRRAPGRGAQSVAGAGVAGPRRRLGRAQVWRGAPSDGGDAGLPDGGGEPGAPFRTRLRAQRDDVGELVDGLEVPEGRQASQPERVEAIAGQ